MPPTVDFFVSYTKVDEGWAQWVAWQLEQEGFSCVLQARDFVPGRNFIREMKEALESCRQLIAILSPDYFKSHYAQTEFEAAFAANMVLPVRVRQAEIPKLYRTCIHIDLVDQDVAQAQDALIDGVRASLVGISKTKKPVFPGRPKFPGPESLKPAAMRSPSPSSSQSSAPLRLLLLGCSAGSQLDIRGEFTRLRAAIRESAQPSAFTVRQVFNVTADKLFDELNTFRPDVFHFSGKQDAGRILMDAPGGGIIAVPEDALTGLLRSLDRPIALAVLDTCYSLQCAREIASVVSAAIGVQSWIYEDDATNYYCRFYQAVAAGRSLHEACAQAQAYAQIHGMAKSRSPQLVCRKNVNPAGISLVTAPQLRKAIPSSGRKPAGTRRR